jgi:hypothetical protein
VRQIGYWRRSKKEARFKNGDWLRANQRQTLEETRPREVPVPLFEPCQKRGRACRFERATCSGTLSRGQRSSARRFPTLWQSVLKRQARHKIDGCCFCREHVLLLHESHGVGSALATSPVIPKLVSDGCAHSRRKKPGHPAQRASARIIGPDRASLRVRRWTLVRESGPVKTIVKSLRPCACRKLPGKQRNCGNDFLVAGSIVTRLSEIGKGRIETVLLGGC